jgi:hypothetical protein
MAATATFRIRRIVLAALVAIPFGVGVTLSGAELQAQGLVHWFTAARVERAAACANGVAPQFAECAGGRGNRGR